MVFHEIVLDKPLLSLTLHANSALKAEYQFIDRIIPSRSILSGADLKIGKTSR